MKYIFLDTNIYLHYLPFDKINWEEITESSKNTIILPYIIIREIDEKKSDGKREHIRNSASEVSRKISKYIDNLSEENDNPITIKADKLYIQFQDYSSSENTKNNDEQLLMAVASYIKETKNPTYLITDDNSLKHRARMRKIPFLDMPESYRKEIKDEQTKKIKELEQQIEQLKGNDLRPELDLFFKDTRNKQNDFAVPSELSADDFITQEKKRFKVTNEEKVRAYIRRNYEMPEVFSATASNRILANSSSDIQIVTERYNEAVNKYIDEIERKANDIVLHKNLFNRTIGFHFILFNDGKAPANNILIKASIPEQYNCSFFEERLEFNKADNAFEIPESFTNIANSQESNGAYTFELSKRPEFDPYIHYTHPIKALPKPWKLSYSRPVSTLTALGGKSTINRPTISEDRKIIKIHLESLKHHLTEEIVPIYVYIADPKIKVLKIEYEIIADNHPDVFRGSLEAKLLNKELTEDHFEYTETP